MLLSAVSSRGLPRAGVKLNQCRLHRLPVRATQNGQFPVLDDKLQKVLSSPFDVVAFGPRVALAAALSLTETSETMQRQLSQLVQDPRPIEQKGEEFVKDVQVTLADYAERGRTLEADIVKNALLLLPEEFRSLLPPEVQTGAAAPNTASSNGTGTSTAVVDVDEEEEDPFDYATFSSAAMKETQAATELADLKSSVENLKVAVNALSSNEDPMKDNMLKLSVREARDGLSRRMQQLSPGITATAEGAPIAAALQEASALLADVNKLPF